jgi:diguanylate cyclase (GGDEF)-like protein
MSICHRGDGIPSSGGSRVVHMLYSMLKPTALVKPVSRPAGSAALRLAVTVALAALATVGLGVVAIFSGASTGGRAVPASLVVAGTAVLAAVQVVLSLYLYRARTDLARRHAEIEGMASVDALTGAANRRAFECELERHVRPGAELALLLIDLDNLKSINDSVGHSVGDEVLRGTVQRIQSCLRTTDVVSRLSGDEFAVLLPRAGDRDDLEVIARRIVEAVQRPYPAELLSCTISASVGVVMMEGEAGPGELLRNADVALMCAKRQGKSRYVLYRAEIHSSEVERIAFERDLRTALERDQFILHYQPIVDSKNRRILGVEALVRWQHPERGLVPPLDFIPLAEETGLIVPLGAWVLREACIQTQKWRTNYPKLFKDFLLSVNVSARQLFGTQLQNDVVAALNESGLDPRHLVLEIVESQVMTDVHAALRQFAALKEIGVRIAIDDFGTGYSSLGYLQDLPVDFLKLDKSFTDNIAESVKSQELMRTVAQLSRALSIATVAEGVETLEQADVLNTLDVNLCQGFYFARPIDAASLSRMLKRVRHLPEAVPAARGLARAAGGRRINVPVPNLLARVAAPHLSN